jgi:PAS domain S-box-containing protein
MLSPTEPGIARTMAKFTTFSSMLAVGFGLLVLTGWMFHIHTFKTILPGWVAVKANTGACFVFIGLALWLVKRHDEKRRNWTPVAQLLSLVVSIVGVLSFLEYWYGWNLGIDQLLFAAGPEDIPSSVRPGLMSPITALGFLLLGPVVALLDSKTRTRRWVAQFLAFTTAIICTFGLLDFVLDFNTTHTFIALPTALLLFLLSFGLVCARTEWGLGRLFASATVGGTLVRRLLPAAIIVPIVIAWLRTQGQSAGLYSDWTGIAIMTVSAATLLSFTTVWTAFVIDRTDGERQQAQASVRQLAAIVTSSQDAILGKTLDGIVTSWNPGAVATYGYSAEEMIGRSLEVVIPDGRRDEFKGFMQQIMRGEYICHYETSRIRKDGQTFSVSLSVSPIRDASGRIVGASTIARDITGRKRAEEQLRQASLYTRSLIEASLDPLVTISREGKITDVNQATETITGVARDRLIGSDFCDYFTKPEDARRGYEEVFAKGFAHDYPLAIRHSSGSTTDVLYNATVFKNERGEIVGVFAAARDVTARKRAEEEIRKLNRELEDRVQQRTTQLRESEKSIRRKLDSILSPEGDLETLELGDILDIPTVQSLLEDFYTVAHVPMAVIDLKGKILAGVGWQKICTEFHRVHPETAKNCIESDMLLSAGVAPGAFKVYKCKNNMWDVATPIMVGEQRLGNLFAGQFFFTDDTLDNELFRSQARRYGFNEENYLQALETTPRVSREVVDASMAFLTKLAQVLSQLNYGGVKLARSMTETTRVNTELAASVKELEAFTYSVSHDLRAPLRHISGFSKILMEEFGASLPADARHHLQRIEEGTHRMGQLVDDLLNLARVGRRELSLQVAGLKTLVDEVIRGLQPEIGDRQVEWKIGNLPYVECDPGLMKQVFQNLLSNAVKFTRPRTPAVIEVGQQQHHGETIIYVRDNGVGFSMKYADKLFGVFQRLHRTEDFEGTGVGLATVQRIIHKHGGRIWVEAELDMGATFYFTVAKTEKTDFKAEITTVGEKT